LQEQQLLFAYSLFFSKSFYNALLESSVALFLNETKMLGLDTILANDCNLLLIYLFSPLYQIVLTLELNLRSSKAFLK
jgi:hypothetical protein